MLGSLVQHHVVDGDKQRMFGDVLRRLQFIGGAHQLLRSLYRLVHMDDTSSLLLLLLFLALHLETNNLALDLLNHNRIHSLAEAGAVRKQDQNLP